MKIGLDFDDTLVNSSFALRSALEALGTEMGKSVSYKDEYNSMKLEDILLKVFPFASTNVSKIKFMELYPSIGIPLIEWKPQALELLNALTKLNHELYIISAKQQFNLELALNNLDGIKYFREIIGGAQGPDKAKYMQMYELEIYLGDSLQDMVAADVAMIQGIQFTTNKVKSNQIVELLEFLNYVS